MLDRRTTYRSNRGPHDSERMAARRRHRRDDDAGKLTETERGGVWSISKETRYMGGQEIYLAYSGGSVQVERETFFVSDSGKRMCILETTTVDSGTPVSSPTPKVRYQLDDHLGSACVELDASANLISYEEYYPYGTTSYQAKDTYLDGYPKRYRYSGKERDEESGLVYYGARYLAPWLCRRTSPDPGGTIDGLNLWNFVNGDPVGSVDVGAMDSVDLVNMPVGEAALSQGATETLEQYGGAIDNQSSVTVLAFIVGTGTPEFNLNLSRQRAKLVAQTLVDGGLDAGQLNIVWLGKQLHDDFSLQQSASHSFFRGASVVVEPPTVPTEQIDFPGWMFVASTNQATAIGDYNSMILGTTAYDLSSDQQATLEELDTFGVLSRAEVPSSSVQW